MKRFSARVATLGLSTITLASTVSFPVHAQAPEESESLVLMPEDTTVATEEITSQEAEIPEEAAAVAQDLEELPQVENAVTEEDIPSIDATVEATENIEKAAEAMTEATEQADAAATEANEIAQEINETSKDALAVANEALAVVSGEDVTQFEAEAIIVDSYDTVDEAEEKYSDAEASYNDKLAEFEAAKNDYETAVAAYNQNKENATADLSAAEDGLTAAYDRLTSLETELENAKQELINAGAAALITADENKNTDVTTYIASVVQYYYLPNTELEEGQSLDSFTVTATNNDYISVSYNICDAEGNVIRTVTGDYGYEIDSETGEVQLYDNRLVYSYIDAAGNTVELSKEEAESLENGQVAIDSYYTATGFYIPRYTDDAHYNGYIPVKEFSDAAAINQGKESVEKDYSTDHYNVEADFKDGTYQGNYFSKDYYLDINYEVDYDKIDVFWGTPLLALYQSYEDIVNSIEADGGIVVSSKEEYYLGIVRYVRAYEVDEDIAATNYESYDDAVSAVEKQAKDEQKATGIDLENSALDIAKQIVYATPKQLFNSIIKTTDEAYVSYIDKLKKQLGSYNELLSQVSDAKSQYELAKASVIALNQKISQLDAANDINTAETVTRLSNQLEKAKEKMTEARENIDAAYLALQDAEEIYFEKFSSFYIGNPTINDPVVENPGEEPETQPTKPEVEDTKPETTPEKTEDVVAPEKEDVAVEVLEPEVVAPEVVEPEAVEAEPVIINTNVFNSASSSDNYSAPGIITQIPAREAQEIIEEVQPEVEPEPEPELENEIPALVNNNNNNSNSDSNGSQGGTAQDEAENAPAEQSEEAAVVEIPDEEVPLAITAAGLLARGKWFVGLAGMSAAGAGVAVFEAKRRAAMKLLDKLNQ